MEVHAHTHTARKKWTHYFWEFLMLFLAVFCGFMAENQREHYVEAQKAKEYAKSFYHDIKGDTADIHNGIRHLKFYISGIDSILSVAATNYRRSTVPGRFYYYSRIISNTYPIDWNRSTLNQLIQSGNLRYFKNKELVDKINSYFALQSLIDGSSGNDDEQRVTIRNLRNRMLDNSYFSVFASQVVVDDAVDQKPIPTLVDSLMKSMLPLQKGGEQYMNEYLNNLNDRSMRLNVHLNKYFSYALINAKEIMKMLKEEYHLK